MTCHPQHRGTWMWMRLHLFLCSYLLIVYACSKNNNNNQRFVDGFSTRTDSLHHSTTTYWRSPLSSPSSSNQIISFISLQCAPSKGILTLPTDTNNHGRNSYRTRLYSKTNLVETTTTTQTNGEDISYRITSENVDDKDNENQEDDYDNNDDTEYLYDRQKESSSITVPFFLNEKSIDLDPQEQQPSLSSSMIIPTTSPMYNDDSGVLSSSDDIDNNTVSDDDDRSRSLLLPKDGFYTMMGLMFLVGSLSSLDRVAMSVAIVPMSVDMLLSDTDKGSISSFFSVGYGLGIVPAGLLLSSSKLSPRYIMSYGIGLWSIGTILTPIAAAAAASTSSHDMTWLWTARAVVGASESVVVPTIQRLLSSWAPTNMKSVAVATVFCGFQFGTILAYALSPTVIETFGGGDWRSVFYLYGGTGLLFLIPWLLLSQDAPLPSSSSFDSSNDEKSSSTTTSTTDLSVATQPATIDDDSTLNNENPLENAVDLLKSAPWKDFVRSKATWAMFLAHAANNWGLYNNLSWTPTFYNEQYGLNVKESTWLLILPSIAGAIGGLLSGSVADGIIRRLDSANEDSSALKTHDKDNEGVTRVRKTFQFVALFGPAVCLFLLSQNSLPDQPSTAVTLLSVAIFLQSFNAAGYGAANQEKSGPKWTGLLYAATSLPSVVVGTAGVYLTGKILDATGQDWSIVFTLNACVFVLGAVAFATLYDSKQEFE